MPVFPLVGSTSQSPGSISPSRSAARIISRAGRSLAEPPGLNDSIFAATVAPAGESTWTSGEPIVSRMLPFIDPQYGVQT